MPITWKFLFSYLNVHIKNKLLRKCFSIQTRLEFSTIFKILLLFGALLPLVRTVTKSIVYGRRANKAHCVKAKGQRRAFEEEIEQFEKNNFPYNSWAPRLTSKPRQTGTTCPFGDCVPRRISEAKNFLWSLLNCRFSLGLQGEGKRICCDLSFCYFTSCLLKVTTVQLNNNTESIWGGSALRHDFSNGTLLRTLEQQQDKGIGDLQPVSQ